MTKEEILQKSRGENAGRDTYDLEVQKTAATVAYFASFGLCALVSAISWILARKVSAQVWIVFFGMLSVAFFVKFFKMKKLHELFVALGYLAILAALTAVFVLDLLEKL
ncbi:MAG: hypothetical protein J6V90_12965 [Treponema sp.]|nr:hypothetical protein [Treponema sp.]